MDTDADFPLHELALATLGANASKDDYIKQLRARVIITSDQVASMCVARADIEDNVKDEVNLYESLGVPSEGLQYYFLTKDNIQLAVTLKQLTFLDVNKLFQSKTNILAWSKALKNIVQVWDTRYKEMFTSHHSEVLTLDIERILMQCNSGSGGDKDVDLRPAAIGTYIDKNFFRMCLPDAMRHYEGMEGMHFIGCGHLI